MFGQYVHFMRFAPKGNEYSLHRYRTQMHRYLEVLEERLGHVPYLGGNEYSIADMATWPWARLAPALAGAEQAAKFTKVAAWAAKIAEHPAAKRALAAVDEIRTKATAFDKAHPETLDRVFGRGAHTAA
jgi:GST-like protein